MYSEVILNLRSVLFSTRNYGLDQVGWLGNQARAKINGFIDSVVSPRIQGLNFSWIRNEHPHSKRKRLSKSLKPTSSVLPGKFKTTGSGNSRIVAFNFNEE